METKSFVNVLVVTFIVGLLLGGFLTGGITGYFVKSATTISVIPKEIITGFSDERNKLTIQIIPGREGAEVIYEIKRDHPFLSDDNDPRIVENLWCRGYDDFGNRVIKTGSDRGSKCFSQKTFTYTIPAKGFFIGTSYYVRVFDFTTKTYMKSYFKVSEYGTPEFGDSRS